MPLVSKISGFLPGYHPIKTCKVFNSFRKMRKGSFLWFTFYSFSTNFAVLRLLLYYSKDEDSNIWFCVSIMPVLFICEIWSPVRAKRDVVWIQVAVHRCQKPIKFPRIFCLTYRNIQITYKAISLARQFKAGQKLSVHLLQASWIVLGTSNSTRHLCFGVCPVQ